MEAKRGDFNSDTAAICLFVKGLWVYEKDPQILIGSYQTVGEAQCGETCYSYCVTLYGEHDVKQGQKICLWQDRLYWSPLPSCAVLQLQQFGAFCPGLPRENSTIRNTSSPQKI